MSKVAQELSYFNRVPDTENIAELNVQVNLNSFVVRRSVLKDSDLDAKEVVFVPSTADIGITIIITITVFVLMRLTACSKIRFFKG